MRSLRTKLVMIMVILILALMCVIGAFLINGVGNFYISQFYEQMEKTFSPDFIGQLQTIPAQEQSAPVRMKELLMAQAGLGIDIATRNVYILDETGNVLASSNQETNVSMTAWPSRSEALTFSRVKYLNSGVTARSVVSMGTERDMVDS